MNVALKQEHQQRPRLWNMTGVQRKKTRRTFLVHQHLKLILHVLIPLGDVYVQGVVAARFLVRRLLPALKRFEQAVPRLWGHMVD